MCSKVQRNDSLVDSLYHLGMRTDNVQDPAPASPRIPALVASSSATTPATTSTTIAAKRSHKKASNTASLNGASCAAGGIRRGSSQTHGIQDTTPSESFLLYFLVVAHSF